MPSDEEIAAILIVLAQRRGRGASFCPSEAARALCADWRPLMPRIRRVAEDLTAQGVMVATQKGVVVSLAEARGPVRLRLR